MQGIDIFTHALRMVFGNFATVLRIGGVALVVLVLLYQTTGEAYFAPPPGDDALPELPSLAGIFLGLARIVVGLWVVVAWHRYILLEEQPGPLAPQWNGAAVWSYIKAGFFYTIALIAAIIPMAILTGVLLIPLMGLGAEGGLIYGLVFMLVLYLPAAWVAYRLAPVLPAAAIGRPLKLAQAWASTRSAGAGFVGLAVVTLVANWVIGIPAGALGSVSAPLGLLWVAVVNWVALMVGASILMTIYGVYVERRALSV